MNASRHIAGTIGRGRAWRALAAMTLAAALATASCSSQPTKEQGSAVANEVGPAGPTQPADEVNEPDITGTPEIIQQGASLDQPTHAPVAEPAADKTPVQLAPIANAVPEPEIAETPAAVNVPAYSQMGDLTSNMVGCEGKCIVEALLRFHDIQADLDFTIETNVDTKVHLWISTHAPAIIGGVPVFPGRPPAAVSSEFAHEWATSFSSLQYDTTYYLIVRATDLYGNRQYATTPVTTRAAPGPDDFAVVGDGCYLQCITGGQVIPGDDYSSVELVVLTSVYADFNIAISDQDPGSIGSVPLLPADEAFEITAHGPTGMRGSATGLAADTTYNVVIKATDLDGFTAHAVGQFHTTPLPQRVPGPTDVLIMFERFELITDGDSLPGNRGEIELIWGLDDGSYIAMRGEDKLTDGDVVDLPADSGRWVSVEPDADIPGVIFNARERDYWDARGGEQCVGGSGLQDFAGANAGCGTTTNVAELSGVTIAWIEEQALCSTFGLTGDAGNDRCYLIGSGDLGSDFVRLRGLVRFHIGSYGG